MPTSVRRNVIELSQTLFHKLNLYALTATAAGVGALAMTTPAAEAKIIYTKTNKVIIDGNGLYFLDVNNDGVADFFVSSPSERSTYSLGAGGARGQTASIISTVGEFLAALPAGAKVGPKNKFSPVADMAVWFAGSYPRTAVRAFSGPWAGKSGKGVKNRYLGLKFMIKGKVHYGWARLTTNRTGRYGPLVTLRGYAYETVPNKTIVTGNIKGPDVVTVQPGSLGQLARGKR